MEALFGNDKRIQTILEQAGKLRGDDSTTTNAGRVAWDRESLLGDVMARAKELGTWIEDIDTLIDRVIGNGQENDVFLSVDGRNVIKLNNFALVPKHAYSLEGFVHRLQSHNALFPECAYTIIGFTYNADNEICVVMTQPFIKAIRYAKEKEIDDFLEDCGYTVDMDDIWFDGRYELSDLKSSNVLVDENENLHFIDAVVNDITVKVDKINRISIRHPEKRTKQHGVTSA